uniref:Uncharacterized protein n=1 Tax=Kalanchoe fedtschenkoi TaxID=63787 RepID=A0A7N0RI94_KALFE
MILSPNSSHTAACYNAYDSSATEQILKAYFLLSTQLLLLFCREVFDQRGWKFVMTHCGDASRWLGSTDEVTNYYDQSH